MSFTQDLEKHFNLLCDAIFKELKSSEQLVLNLTAEDQDYIRFNNSQVRQATHVKMAHVKMIFQSQKRKVSLSTDLSFHLASDQKLLSDLLQHARGECQALPEDPYFVELENRGNSHNHFSGRLPTADQAIQSFGSLTEGTDFTGLYASGPLIRANRNSVGQSHWFSTENFMMDYSLYTVNSEGANKAVKSGFAGSEFKKEKFLAQFQENKNQLSLLKKANKKLKPGGYRTYLDFGAMNELCGMLSWGALSFAQYKKGQCAFTKLANGQEKLSEKFSVKENYKLGTEPQFNSLGEMSPLELPLIEKGQLKNWLVSSRTAKEYGVASNGANLGWFNEYVRAMEVSPGTLAKEDILKELGTGIYLSQLHYLNWSDVQTARITGMTRYACFWVENGEIAGPIQDMRFDDSLFRILGSELVDLTAESSLIPATDTYEARGLGAKNLPGALINDFHLTL